MDRRTFLMISAALWPAQAAWAGQARSKVRKHKTNSSRAVFDLAAIEKDRVMRAAEMYLGEEPETVTATHSPRSAGGPHDFFSEGDYWWPDPANPDGPYIQKDGMSNPDNFVAHRQALMKLSVQVPALAAAYVLTQDRRFADHAVSHLRAWFLNPDTMMNPNLQYAQAIQGRFTGRGTGIIDTIHLVEVVRAIPAIAERRGSLSKYEMDGLKKWFTQYVTWMTTNQNGIDEREAKNNHGTCWVMQVAAFASFVGDTKQIDYCKDRFKTVLLPHQLAPDGSFPEELHRTKPYGYSLFNLDAMSTVCQILSTRDDNLWTFTLDDGRNMGKALAYMAPYIKDKKKWPKPPDVMYFDQWPMRHPSLLFGGLALGKQDYLNLWKTLPADSTVPEVIRNFFIRQPLLWVSV